MVIFLVSTCLLILIAQCILCLISKKYLVALYAVCYSVPFLGLVSCLWGETITLWPIGDYDFYLDDLLVYRLSLVWFLGVVGGLVAYLLSLLVPGRSLEPRETAFFSAIDFKLAGLIFLALAIFFIAFRFINADALLEMFAGVESVVVFSIIAITALAFAFPSKLMLWASVVLVMAYCVANAMTGDRDFVVLVVAYILGLMFRYNKFVKLKVLLLITAFLVFVLVSGVFVSMSRMDVDLTSDNITQYFLFNSWNAIILPLVQQLTSFWDGEHLRYGQTYLDMFLSLAPSPIYSAFGVEKPIMMDNPALWYYITGLGGIHVAGVAFENFGLFGVFLNGFISVCFLRLIDSRCRDDDFLRIFLYMLCAASVMHWVWYGEIYLLNSLVFYVMSLGLFFAMKLVRVLK
ncbi:Oligosaccharide repeat unit polymerase [Pseudomonas sp. IT-P258]|uniref:oligosaccharide repeat unit polymerase n=1 Tax=Pseudomonas sp. IT-P258 TaxID=3026447 RepID=UPI0039E1108F